MATSSSKKKLTRGEKMLLVAPLFVLLVASLTLAYKNLQPRLFAWCFPHDIQNPQGRVFSIQSSPDGKQIIVRSVRYDGSFAQSIFQNGTETYFLTSWDVKSKRMLWSMPVMGTPGTVVFSPDSRSFLLIRRNYSAPTTTSNLELRDADTGQVLWLDRTLGYGNSASFTSDSKQVAVASNFIETFDASTGASLRTFPPRVSSIYLRSTTDGKTILLANDVYSSYNSGLRSGPSTSRVPPIVRLGPPCPSRSEIQMFDIASGRRLRSFLMREISWFEIIKGRDEVVAATYPNGAKDLAKIQIWNYRTGHFVRTLPDLQSAKEPSRQRCISADGNFLFCFNRGYITANEKIPHSNRKSGLIDLRTGKILWTIPAVIAPAFCQFSPDGRFIGTSEYHQEGEGFHRVILRDAKKGVQLKSCDVNDSRGTRVTFTGDSRHMIFASDDHIYIWNTSSPAEKL